MDLEEVLEAYKAGEFELDEALTRIRGNYFQDLGHTVLDHDRQRRTGAGEVIFGEGKSAEQIADIIDAITERQTNLLVTRLDPEKFAALTNVPSDAAYHPDAGILSWHGNEPDTPATSIAVVSAGTSDHAVAEEAALTAEFFGNSVSRIADVGVAGLHRILARIDDLRSVRVLIVVAGMEGALPSVVAGHVACPVFAVPTSVGYGASFGGIAALLGMLNSCAANVAVVNIDAGFKAGYLAGLVAQT